MTTDVLVYTVPADRTALVKNVAIANAAAGSITVRLGIGGTGNGQVVLRTGTIPTNSGLLVTDTYLVFQPGDAIYVAASVANAATVSLHGVQLLGAPA